jgi:competence protein ComEC
MLGWLTGSCLWLISQCVQFSCDLPAGHLWLPSPPIWWSAIFYGILGSWLILFKVKRLAILSAILVGWLVLGLSLFAFGPRGYLGWPLGLSEESGELRCTFLDVGHGTCVVLELPDGRVWLYDAGHMGASERSHEQIAQALWHLDAARIDTLVLSHADADHYNAVAGLIPRFAISRIVTNSQFWQNRSTDLAALSNALDWQEIDRTTWHASLSERIAGVTVDVLHPTLDYKGESDNASSLCLQVEYGGTRVLLPGDLEGSGLLTVSDLEPRQCKLLMAPHHGSLSHDPSSLVTWCQPQHVVISGNHRTMRPAVLERYALARTVNTTFLSGAIQARLDHQGQVSLFHWSKNRWEAMADEQ